MAKGINKVILVGNLGADPEEFSAGANFSIATTESWKDKNTGEKQERTEWHLITAFGKLGEICNKYLTRGARVYVEGKLQTDKWQDTEGNDRYTTNIIINEMVMLDSRSGAASLSSEAGQNSPQPGTNSTATQPAADGDEWDDDIPF